MVAAASHIHSSWSYDAKWSLRQLAGEFTRRGYRVLLLTEHDRGFSEDRFQRYRDACAQASSGDLLVIPGMEYSDSENVVHILTWGLTRFLGEDLPTSHLLEMVTTENGVAVLAHPARREAWKCYDASWAKYLLGIEIWNRKADGWAPSPVAATLLSGTALVPFASLDFHCSKQMFPLSMQLDIFGEVTEENVLACLRTGRCSAMAFSESVEKFTGGWKRLMLAHAEKTRRGAAFFYRGLKRAIAS